jgi:hypothetical protein
MDPHLAEVVSEAGLEEGAHGVGQGLAAVPQGVDIGLDIGSDLGGVAGGGLGLEGFLLFFLLHRLAVELLFALVADPLKARLRRGSSDWRSLCPTRVWHTHYRVGHAVGFLLGGVVRLADRELGLDRSRPQQALHGLVAEGVLHFEEPHGRMGCPRGGPICA